MKKAPCNAWPPLSAALDHRRNGRLLHCAGSRRAGALALFFKVEYEKLHKIVLTIVREDAVCLK